MATGVILGQPEREELEIMETIIKPIKDVIRLAENGEIKDASSALAIFQCKERDY